MTLSNSSPSFAHLVLKCDNLSWKIHLFYKMYFPNDGEKMKYYIYFRLQSKRYTIIQM